MFSKAKRDKGDERQLPEFEEQSLVSNDQGMTRRAETRSASRAKQPRPAPSGVPSLISADMTIRGEVRAAGEVQFDGQIDGDIHAKGLVIGEGAEVRGEVVAEKVKVAGSVEGVIRATRVELTATSVVKGDVLHTALMIEAGARFEGNCRHSDDPLSDTVANASARELPAPAHNDLTPAPVPAPREPKLREQAPAPLHRDNQGEAPAKQASGQNDALPPLRQSNKPLSGKVNLR
ncbi:MAG: polymer-forming cytoskeletal protein [Pseudomonadota bacterium]